VTTMSRDELLSLPPAVGLDVVAKALNIGRTTCYQLARAGELPVPVLRLGAQYRVASQELLRVLGMGSEPAPIGQLVTGRAQQRPPPPPCASSASEEQRRPADRRGRRPPPNATHDVESSP
jgi:excisionase family DNA binding protein